MQTNFDEFFSLFVTFSNFLLNSRLKLVGTPGMSAAAVDAVDGILITHNSNKTQDSWAPPILD